MPRVDYDKLTSDTLAEASAQIRARVEVARQVQRERFQDSHLSCNADMTPAEVREYCQLDQPGRSLLRAAMERMGLTARGFHYILKLSRTITDMEGFSQIQTHHLAQALQYRPRSLL